MDATTIAVDLAKDVFEVAESRRPGAVQRRRRLSRRQFAALVESLDAHTTVVMEACSTAHYWARRCQARGAAVRLLPARYVRPYVRRQKTDRTDAEALLEAHRCAALRPVAVKTLEQQAIQTLHRVRQQWQKTRTMRLNLLRAIAREHGLAIPKGAQMVRRHAAALLDETVGVPPLVQRSVRVLLDELDQLEQCLASADAQVTGLARTHAVARRLQQVPGVGPLTATALVGSVPHIGAFRNGRAFANWLGLTPRISASADRQHLGRISKQGDRYLRMLLVHGARSVLASARRHPGSWLHQWGAAVAQRRGQARAIVAIANRLARIIWATWSREVPYRTRPAVA
jgi:transposase